MRLQQGVNRTRFVLPLTMETPATPANSQLLIVREGNRATAHTLYISELETAFHFRVSERYEVHTRSMARDDEPGFIQRIPVTISGK
jgi:hypothetical protein